MAAQALFVTGAIAVPKPNYRFDKKQRELKKSVKQEEKRLKKQKGRQEEAGDTDAPVAQAETPQEQTS